MNRGTDVAGTVANLAPGAGLQAAAYTLMETGVFGGVFVAGVFLDADTGALVATSGMEAYSREVVPAMIAELRRQADVLEAAVREASGQ